MKTTTIFMTLSLATFAFIAMVQFVSESRHMELQARLSACDTNPYSCFPPAGAFASLR